ncbi:hypothetical protein LLG90_13360 [Aromatoleum toluclasticum]|uniref:hypothetical protein n=1 Tax=Aromatoleum toluclasticum TaxID=92003 RepID=UPI001D17D492|nr:hypothetical protein [Aromatoleum toluclasticum]MCC4116342.1 hypothetical protein [Aromatoleum toluclasticum]
MDLSTAHTTARNAAARLPALQASFDLLDSGAAAPYVEIYGTARPAAGGAPGGSPLVTVTMSNPPGTVDGALFRIVLTVPIEGQIALAGDALWARIYDGAGAWWADCSVSDEAGSGEIKLQIITLAVGAFVRITSAVFQG